MESLIYKALSFKHYSWLTRYAMTTVFVMIAFFARYSLEGSLQGYPFLLFFPAVFAAALLFDGGSGLYATVLSTILAMYFFIEPIANLSFIDPAHSLAPILFIVICGTMAFVTEVLREALARVAQAERSKDLLLREVNHRIRNDLQGLAALLALQRRQAISAETGERLESVADRVRVLGQIYGRLTWRDNHVAVEMDRFLGNLTEHFQAVHISGACPVEIKAQAEAATLGIECAVALALITNELVTNALKYAFPNGRSGRIEITFRREGKFYVLTVADDGIGMPAGTERRKGGLGQMLVHQFAQQFGGEFVVEAEHGVRATVVFPVIQAMPAG